MNNYQKTSYENLERKQDVILRNRENLQVTGIKKILSLNTNEFIVETTLGKMIIKGTNLEMEQLDTNNGTLVVKGNVYLIEYSDKPAKEKEKSFITKLFR